MIGQYMVALITPFTAGNTVDIKSLKQLIERLLQQGADGFVVLGTTAETPTLSKEERLLIVDTVIETVNHRAAIWVGCGTNCTKESLIRMQMVEEKEIDGIMLVVPYYNRPTQMGMIQHFSYLAKHTKHPIMLYNVPKRTGTNLEVETMEYLVQQYPQIVAIKQASSDVSLCESHILKQHQIKILCGEDSQLLPFLQAGCDGIITVSGHIVLEEICQFMKEVQLGIVNEKRYQFLQEVAQLLFCETSPMGVKYVLSQRKEIEKYLRLPLCELQEENKRRLDVFFDYSNKG
ncbi:MAG: 4-hydroxy-tetrahydrodipicolinate synthase [Erysipelotrichaceae bacterium]|nr:4-hydroxy-tetrahydrodipicolinate synthase [Erysipelotrichaceae bacterium]